MNSLQSRSTIFSLGRIRDELRRDTIGKLRDLGVRPRRSLGQSFVIDPVLVERLVELGSISSKDVVLEIGAGLGTLTKALAIRCRKVYAVEKDKRLCSALSGILRDHRNVETICGDALKVELPDFNKIVSNPPFSISSKLIFKILGREFETAIMTFQDEFASRLIAAPGSKDYGRLTVATQIRADVIAHEEYPPSSFYPEPGTKARLLVIKPRRSQLDPRSQGELDSLLRYVFSQRRRKVAKILENYAKRTERRFENKDQLLTFGERRVFQLSPQEFLDLAKAMSQPP